MQAPLRRVNRDTRIAVDARQPNLDCKISRCRGCVRWCGDRQGVSGLGLEEQQKAVRDWLNGGSWHLVGEFTDIETGKNTDRPELAKAIAACRLNKAKLVIAKLDRLSRKLSFVSALMDRAPMRWNAGRSSQQP